nr:hypothetical protein [Tanacetum cinerariifolium]
MCPGAGEGEGLGTVPVWWGCTGMAGEEGRFWAGKGVRGTVWAPSFSAAAGAREATGEALAGEIHGNSENHSGDAGVLTDDGRV